jgi:hypothetical protein
MEQGEESPSDLLTRSEGDAMWCDPEAGLEERAAVARHGVGVLLRDQELQAIFSRVHGVKREVERGALPWP